MSNENLRHGQALAMQWVAFTMQKVIADIDRGAPITNQLLNETKTNGGNTPFDTLKLGSNYVLNFILPFAVELALKALLTKEGVSFGHIHNLHKLYEKLSSNIKNDLQSDFQNKCGVTSIRLNDLLKRHEADFVAWRYLDKVETLQKDEEEMQLALCSILNIYNK